MRNLTIKRTKSFVGCLAKMKIYIEDHEAGELTVNGVPCRKLGELKSGEEKTFEISQQEAKVFAIADKLSKEYCNEFYQLPEGVQDIYLSGKNKFNPASGNAFRFDNNNSEEVLANRKRSSRKGLLVLIIAMIVGFAIGYLVTAPVTGCSFCSVFRSDNSFEAKTFSSGGMSITLTEEFRETEYENFTVAYESKGVAVFALKEPFSLYDGLENYTTRQYMDVVIEANALDPTEIKTAEGVDCFEYSAANMDTGEVYTYFAYVYKSNDAFWLIQFAVRGNNGNLYAQDIARWAQSVEFEN